MKKIFLIFCGIFACSICSVQAQSNLKQKETVTLGGNAHKSTISVPQILDYPILVLNDKNLHIEAFEISVISDQGTKKFGPIATVGSKFSPEMMADIEQLRNTRSVLKIEHIMIVKDAKLVKEESLEFVIEQ